MYLRMSNKQKAFIEQLSEMLNKEPPHYYQGFSLSEAKKCINRLKREYKVMKKQIEAEKQQTLF